MKAVIMAGGKGTRLHAITNDEIPKPMALMCGKPILERTIANLKSYGIKDFYITVGHLHQKIEQYFKDGSDFGVNIQYIVEDQPLGSAGALYFLKDKLDDDFVVCSADTIFDIDISKMLAYHKKQKAVATLLVRASNHPYDSDLIVCDKDFKVLGIDKKSNVRNYYYQNIANAGYFIINPSALSFFDTPKKVGMEHDFINHLIQTNQNVCAYFSTEYIRDAGTPERFEAVSKDILCGKVKRRNFQNKQKAIFLDRDGVINKYKGFLSDIKDFELFDWTSTAIKKINQSEYLTIVVTNQPVVARGECTSEQLQQIHNKMETLLGKENAYVDAIYFCPHHPDKGFEGEVPELKINCDCRKPKIGMLLKAKEKFNLDFDQCWMIGDGNVDVQTGINAGIKTIKLGCGKQEPNTTKADFYCNNLLDAVNLIENATKKKDFELEK